MAMTATPSAPSSFTPVRHDLGDPAIPEGMVRISAGAEHRYIWPVHLGGWQSLGWQLQPAADLTAPEPRVPEPLLPEPRLAELEPDPYPNPDPDPETEADQAPDAQKHQSDVAEAPPPGASDAGTPLPEATDFQALTKAQIIEHCSTIHGVELDGSQTKAELVEQARALESQRAQLICPPLPDGLVDDPLI
jgi:hypothetical protein